MGIFLVAIETKLPMLLSVSRINYDIIGAPKATFETSGMIPEHTVRKGRVDCYQQTAFSLML